MLTYPDFLRFRYDDRVALTAAVISGIGYLLFTGGQILAGARLASETAITSAPFGWDPFQFSLFLIGLIVIAYTSLGGIKAVIYTDCVQWIILVLGLGGLAIPLAIRRVGGWAALRAALPPAFFSLTNIETATFINWMVTIVPIWLVGMTLYHGCTPAAARARPVAPGLSRACSNIPSWPSWACSSACVRGWFFRTGSRRRGRGLPMLIKHTLPVGVMGMVIAAYFSAIMSTADSTLMASSGHLVTDLIQRYRRTPLTGRRLMRLSQAATLGLGLLALLFAAQFRTVLDAIMYAYGFLVSGLFFPTLGAFFWRRGSSAGALAGMLAGGGLTVVLQLWNPDLGGYDPTAFGLALSAMVYIAVSLLRPDAARNPEPVS
jgi:SSS family solute:Na+ symporter